MKIVLTKLLTNDKYNAALKAPKDVLEILNIPEFLIEIYDSTTSNNIKKIYRHFKIFPQLFKFDKKEIYIFQSPVSYLKSSEINFSNVKKYILLLHDVCTLRNGKLNKSEIKLFKNSLAIISHNQVMTNYLISQGIDSKKIVNLELFDYLCDEVEYKNKDISNGLTIAYAGNIDKALFIKQLDQTKMNFEMNLYGVKSDNLQINDKLHYIGKETPERLPNLIDAHLGLVWDGNIDSSDESDILKNYTKYNNPHKVSCYLAAGIPVIVWSKSAIWNFVRDNNCGYAIDNIYDINNLDLSDYEEKRKNAIEISKKVRSGYYTKKAFNTVFEKLGLEDRIK